MISALGSGPRLPVVDSAACCSCTSRVSHRGGQSGCEPRGRQSSWGTGWAARSRQQGVPHLQFNAASLHLSAAAFCWCRLRRRSQAALPAQTRTASVSCACPTPAQPASCTATGGGAVLLVSLSTLLLWAADAMQLCAACTNVAAASAPWISSRVGCSRAPCAAQPTRPFCSTSTRKAALSKQASCKLLYTKSDYGPAAVSCSASCLGCCTCAEQC